VQSPEPFVSPAVPLAPVLLVEDDANTRHVMQRALEAEGLPVLVAEDGWAALKLAARQRPALVILDWHLPGLNAQEVAVGLRAAYPGQVPILLVTANAAVDELAWSVRAYSCIKKPFDVQELLAAVSIGLGGPEEQGLNTS
jgi:DNA-binding response OmpR family regulator